MGIFKKHKKVSSNSRSRRYRNCAYCGVQPTTSEANSRHYVMCCCEACPVMPVLCNENRDMARRYWNNMQSAVTRAHNERVLQAVHNRPKAVE